jgi:hypothetical protein
MAAIGDLRMRGALFGCEADQKLSKVGLPESGAYGLLGRGSEIDNSTETKSPLFLNIKHCCIMV